MRTVVVTIVRGRHEHLARQRHWLAGLDVAVPPQHVVVVMGGDDPACVLDLPGPPVDRLDVDGDGPLPLAAARNLGARRAVELGAELLVFLDVDVLPLPDLLDAAATSAARHPDAVLLGQVRHLRRGVVPEGVEAWDEAQHDPRAAAAPPPGGQLRPALLWSLLFAVTPTTWERTGGFHEGYVGYGAEDTDLGMACADRGVPLRWVPDVRGLHQWHPEGEVTTRAADLVRNATTFRGRWGWWPMQGWLHELAERGLVRFDPAADVCRVLPAAGGRQPAPRPGSPGRGTARAQVEVR